jgi:hypothetical protein
MNARRHDDDYASDQQQTDSISLGLALPSDFLAQYVLPDDTLTMYHQIAYALDADIPFNGSIDRMQQGMLILAYLGYCEKLRQGDDDGACKFHMMFLAQARELNITRRCRAGQPSQDRPLTDFEKVERLKAKVKLHKQECDRLGIEIANPIIREAAEKWEREGW